MAGVLTSTRRTYLRYTFLACFAFFFTATLSYLFAAHPADTSATTVGFNPGNIMNDYTMSNYSTMTEAEIQSFLKSKNPCNDTNLSKADYYKQQGFAYHIKDGHFVCMADELFDGVNVGSGETAAHIIYDVSQTYRINPQVLIVLLEKEQGLVTDTWPNYSHQYKTATGYGCPDTAACDSQYFGLRNQLENAAGMFRKLLNGGGNNLYPVGWRDVAYKDRAPWCGSAHIYIENIATGILYTYTPYTPNAAALAAGTGLGDSCSAYGNRNFYHYFTEWFGSTQTGGATVNTSTLPEGNYEIISNLNTIFTLDGSDKNGVAGANVKIALRDGSLAQRWKLTYDQAKGTYKITNLASGKVLDVASGSTAVGANVQLYDSNDSTAQSWRIAKDANGTFYLSSTCAVTNVLDAAGTKDGSNVWSYSYNGTAAQQWHIISASDKAYAKLANGTIYEFRSALNKNFAIDVGGITDGTNVQSYRGDSSIGQRWKAVVNADKTYSFLSAASGKSINVATTSAASTTNVQLGTIKSSCAEKWYVIPNSDSTYTLISACNNKLAIDAKGGVKNGNNIWVFTSNHTNAQRWYIQTSADQTYIVGAAPAASPAGPATVTDGTYAILSNFDRTYAIDISTTNNGANVHLYKLDRSIGQRWKITRNSDGTYAIKHETSGKALDVENASTLSTANVQIYAANSSCAQKWHISANSDSTYTFKSACNQNLAIDAQGGAGNGNNIWVFTSNGTNAQKWALEKL